MYSLGLSLDRFAPTGHAAVMSVHRSDSHATKSPTNRQMSRSRRENTVLKLPRRPHIVWTSGTVHHSIGVYSTFVCLAVCSSGACWTKADVDDVYSFDNSKPASCVVFSLLRGVVYPPLSDCTQFVYRCRIAICAQRGSSSVLVRKC